MYRGQIKHQNTRIKHQINDICQPEVRGFPSRLVLELPNYCSFAAFKMISLARCAKPCSALIDEQNVHFKQKTIDSLEADVCWKIICFLNLEMDISFLSFFNTVTRYLFQQIVYSD